jgi:hypothetical protein
MKHCIKMVILLYLSLFLVSCSTTNEPSSETSKSEASMSSQATTQQKTTVTINCYYEEPEGFRNKDAIIIERELKNDYVEVIIQGKVNEFEYLEVEFDADKNEFIEKGLKAKYSSLENKTVYIETNLPEGIPSEMIRWKSEKGKVYEYIIRDYGLVDQKDNQQIFNLE